MAWPDPVAALIAVVAAFSVSGVWYAVHGRRLAALSDAYAAPRPALATLLVEVARNAVLTVVVADVAERAHVDTIPAGLGLGILLWVGLPLILVVGSVFHERVPWPLAAIHLGDWLLKLMVVSTVLAAWT